MALDLCSVRIHIVERLISLNCCIALLLMYIGCPTPCCFCFFPFFVKEFSMFIPLIEFTSTSYSSACIHIVEHAISLICYIIVLFKYIDCLSPCHFCFFPFLSFKGLSAFLQLLIEFISTPYTVRLVGVWLQPTASGARASDSSGSDDNMITLTEKL